MPTPPSSSREYRVSFAGKIRHLVRMGGQRPNLMARFDSSLINGKATLPVASGRT
jgi:hypothetical protein